MVNSCKQNINNLLIFLFAVQNKAVLWYLIIL